MQVVPKALLRSFWLQYGIQMHITPSRMAAPNFHVWVHALLLLTCLAALLRWSTAIRLNSRRADL